MKYRLNSTSPLNKQLERLVQSANEEISLSLLRACRDPEVGVHDARKACKESRAFLRLLRGEIGNAQYEDLNDFYRAVSAKLSDNRDAVVMQKTWSAICNEAPTFSRASADAVTQTLRGQDVGEALTTTPDRNCLLQLALDVNSQAQAPASWNLPKSRNALKPAIKRLYKKARNAESVAKSSEQIEAFHRFRKRSKDLYYALRALRPTLPTLTKRWVRELRDVTEVQGLANDHAVLLEFVSAHRASMALKESDYQTIRADITYRLQKLQTKSHKMARKLFADSPGQIVKSMKG